MTVLIQTDLNRQLQLTLQALLNPKSIQKLTKLLSHNGSLTKALSEKIPISLPQSKPIAATKPFTADKSVRVCQLSEYKAVAQSLAHAFADDACALYFINTPDRRHWSAQAKWDLHVEIMEYMVYAHMLDGIVTTAGDDYGAVALWMPPGKDMDSPFTTMRSGLWRLHYRLSRVGHRRFFKDFMPLLHDAKQEVLGQRDTNSWYLVYLGTKPEARRKGLARALVEDVTIQADRDGVPIYLECSKEVNIPIYEKFGFDERARIWMGGEGNKDSVPLDLMVREPLSN